MLFLSFLSKDFMRCVSASIILFIISIIAVSKYVDGSSKAAGVKLALNYLITSYTYIIYVLLSTCTHTLHNNISS